MFQYTGSLEARKESIQKWINGIDMTQVEDGKEQKMESDTPLPSDSHIQELPKAKPKKKIGPLRKVKKNVGRRVALEADKQVVASVEGKREVGRNLSDSDGKEGAEKSLSIPHLQPELGKRLHVEAMKMSQSNTVMAQGSAVMVLNEEPLVIAPLPEGTKPLEMQSANNDNEMPEVEVKICKRKLSALKQADSKSSNHEDGSPKAMTLWSTVPR